MEPPVPLVDMLEVEFANNPEPRCPCVLVLDTSGSMSGEPIRQLNEGLRLFRDEVRRDPVASLRVEVAVVEFDSGARLVRDFVTIDRFEPPALVAKGSTAMAAGVELGLDLVERRKETYRKNGVDYYRPWLLLVTDGGPTDPADKAAQAARRAVEADEQRKVTVFAVGVDGADLRVLQTFSRRPPQKLRGLCFGELFKWLSKSVSQVSHSQTGDKVSLPPVSWNEVD